MFEPAYFRDERARITSQVVELEGLTCRVSDIQSAAVAEGDKPEYAWLRKVEKVAFGFVVALSILRLLLDRLGWLPPDAGDFLREFHLVPVLVWLVASFFRSTLGKQYQIALEGTFGTILALPSTDRLYLVEVVGAIRRAVEEMRKQPGTSSLEEARTGL